MPKIAYIKKRFNKDTLTIVQLANNICVEYRSNGFDLTLRQLYYQMVASNWIPNNEKEYDKLGSIINNARLAGFIDWDYIIDRTRFIRENPHWESPKAIIESAIDGFAIDKWEGQDYRIEAWIEKDALIGIIERVCNKWDIPYFSCRGYVSQSKMWSAAQRILERTVPTVILHLGDHDPSGMDMTRDIRDRLDLFTEGGIKNKKFRLVRIALNMDQVQSLNPPPNPAKISDSRCAAYIKKYGSKSWELDALKPEHIITLLEGSIKTLMSSKKWKVMVEKETDMRSDMAKVGEKWDEIIDGLK